MLPWAGAEGGELPFFVWTKPSCVMVGAVIGVVSILYGGFVAMAQTDFKRMVAYSSVSHMGYVLLGASAFTSAGLNGAAMQMFTHGTSSAMLFLLVGVAYDRAHHREIEGFGGLANVAPIYTGVTTLGFFAALGLPGMSGFDVLQQLSGPLMPAVIFVTAYDEYAVRAFEANALDYLLKPINDDRLAESVTRTEHRHSR